MLYYYDFFKEHNKFDFNSLIYDVNDLFNDFTIVFPSQIFKRIKHHYENTEKEKKEKHEKFMLSLISSSYCGKRSHSLSHHESPKNLQKKMNLSFSEKNEKKFLNIKNHSFDKSTVINLKSRKITLNELEVEKVFETPRKNEKRNCFRIINTENSEHMSRINEINEPKNNDEALFESVFKSKTIFQKKISSYEKKDDKRMFPTLIKKERTNDLILQTPIRAEEFRYIKQLPDLHSFKNLQHFAKDYLQRFIIHKNNSNI